MTKNNNDIISFHPGYYIREIIEDMEMTQEEFAVRLGTTAKTISSLVNEKINISKDLALKLSNMLNTSPDVWLNLQKKYDIQIIEQKQRDELNSQCKLIKEIDYDYFVKLGLLSTANDDTEKIKNLCSFLSLSKLSILTEADYNISYRNGIKSLNQKNVLSANIWVETATKFGRKYAAEPFSETKLKASVKAIANMTAMPFDESISLIKNCLSECGVIFVTLPYLKNSYIYGVVKWLNKDKVLVAVSDKIKYADEFWFTLFHEIGHVFQKKIKDVSYTWEKAAANDFEKDADKFANYILVPDEQYIPFLNQNDFTEKSILKFAKQIERSPSIVVGRLQNDKRIQHNQLNHLKTKIPESVFAV